MRTATAALGGLATVVALQSGCDFTADVNPLPTVAKDVLQNEITDRLTAVGQRPQSVRCAEDLVAEVGRSTHCDVVMSPTNSFAPVVTITGVAGAAIDYEV